MTQQKDEFMDLLYEKIDETITEMNQPDYEYVDTMTKKDWLVVVAIGIICLIMVFAGYFVMQDKLELQWVYHCSYKE